MFIGPQQRAGCIHEDERLTLCEHKHKAPNSADRKKAGVDMEFCDYANEEGTWGLCDPHMEENTDELNHRQQRRLLTGNRAEFDEKDPLI